MKKRDPFAYRPSRLRRAPAEQFADLERAARAALAALVEPRAAIALIVARPIEDGTIAMHSAVAGAGERALARILEDGPGNLAEFIEHRLMTELERSAAAAKGKT